MTNTQLNDKVALVTQVNYDIGKTLAMEFLTHGSKVFATYSPRPPLDWSPSSVEQHHDLSSLQVDFAEPSIISTLFDHIQNKVGPVDILVNNVIVTKVPSVIGLTASDFDQHITDKIRATLLLSAEYLTRYLARGSNWGRIVNVCSFSSKDGTLEPSDAFMQSSVKSAVSEITRLMAKEVGPLGVTVNTLVPKTRDTDVDSTPECSLPNSLQTVSYIYSDLLKALASAALLIAAEESDPINGQIITV